MWITGRLEKYWKPCTMFLISELWEKVANQWTKTKIKGNLNPKSRPGFPVPYAVVFCMWNDLRREAIVCIVDNCGIADHHCWYFLIIINSLVKTS